MTPGHEGFALKILVVDDDEAIRRFARRALGEAGYDVAVASGGAEALALVEAQSRFDLLVIDLMMPQMRGDELARRLHRRDPQARMLYFTGFSDHLFEERTALADHEAFVEKPASISGLLEAVSLMRSEERRV